MVQMYEVGKMSRGEIARALGTSVQTVSRMLQKSGVHLEDRSKGRVGPKGPLSEEHKASISEGRKGKGTGTRAEWKKEKRICEWPDGHLDGKPLEYTPKKRDQRYCDTNCRNSAVADREIVRAIKAWDQSPASWCPCNEGRIPYEHRHSRRYCSETCRTNLTPKRMADPANHVDLTCGTCEKTFSRYKGLYKEGARVFCTNECAAKWTRKVRHIGVKDSDVVLDSGYEAYVWGFCVLHKIPIERVDRTEAVAISDGWYAPDFTINGRYVEVKGFEDDDDHARYEAWSKAHPDDELLVLHKADLMRGLNLVSILSRR